MKRKIIDPTDGKTVYPSIQALLRAYSRMPAMDQIGMFLDELNDRPDLSKPTVTINITGTGKPQLVAHGIKDIDGVKAKPRAWHLVAFTALDHFTVLSVDDTNIEVELTNKGVIDLAVFL